MSFRDATTITTANDGFYTEPISGKGSGTFTYKVCQVELTDYLLEHGHHRVLTSRSPTPNEPTPGSASSAPWGPW